MAFVALNTILGDLNTTMFTPSLLHQIPLPATYLVSSNDEASALGVALTHDGCHTVLSVGTAAIVVDVAKAVNGSPAALFCALNGTIGNGAIEVTITPDDDYAFLSQEHGTAMTG